MAHRVIEIVIGLTRTIGQAPLNVVMELLGEDAEEILADCLMRNFIEPIHLDSLVYLTSLGKRCIEPSQGVSAPDPIESGSEAEDVVAPE